MRSAVWVLDPKLPREAADGVASSLAARGLTAGVRELGAGRAVVVENAPEGLERPAGVVRAAVVDLRTRHADAAKPLFLDLRALTVFVFGVLAVTGAALALSYRPSLEGAMPSIVDATSAPGPGWLVRNLHRVAGHALLALAAVQVLRAFFRRRFLAADGAAKWRIHVALGFICVAFLVTGQALPWDQTAYWRTVEAVEGVAAIPFVGPWLAEFVRGGPVVGSSTAVRVFAVHALILPWAAFWLWVAGHELRRRRAS
jgi:menaquinol-cytochrome c reductase cytochrome b subunit